MGCWSSKTHVSTGTASSKKKISPSNNPLPSALDVGAPIQIEKSNISEKKISEEPNITPESFILGHIQDLLSTLEQSRNNPVGKAILSSSTLQKSDLKALIEKYEEVETKQKDLTPQNGFPSMAEIRELPTKGDDILYFLKMIYTVLRERAIKEKELFQALLNSTESEQVQLSTHGKSQEIERGLRKFIQYSEVLLLQEEGTMHKQLSKFLKYRSVNKLNLTACLLNTICDSNLRQPKHVNAAIGVLGKIKDFKEKDVASNYILSEAKKILEEIFSTRLQGSRLAKVLSQFNFPFDVGKDFEKPDLGKELIDLLPTKIISFNSSGLDSIAGLTIMNGFICINETFIIGGNENIARVMLILIHEMGHKKRFLYQAKNYFDKTPKKYSYEAGEHLEKSVFTRKITKYINIIDKDLATMIMKPDNWDDSALRI